MMKAIFICIIILSAGVSMNSISAQETKKVITAEFKVEGVCNMCKERIENAALIKGVKFAEWSKEKQVLKVIYKSKHTDELSIHKAVAKAGHDTEKEKASSAIYGKLPNCCAYRDGVKIH